MNLSVEVVYKLIIAFIGFYFFYRFIIPLIAQYLGDRKGKKNEGIRSLDQMIREKEALLRGSIVKKQGNELKSHNIEENKFTLEELLLQYKNKAEISEIPEEYSPVVDLIENLQWGESQTSKTIIEKSRNKYDLPLSSGSINQILQNFFSIVFFKNIPKFSEIVDFIISFEIIISLMDEEKSSQTALKIAKSKFLLDTNHIIKGAHLLIIKNDLKKDFDEKNFSIIVNKESPVYRKTKTSKNTSLLNLIFCLGETRPLSPDYLIDKIIAESFIVLAVSPLKTNSPLSKEDALNLFHLSDNKNWETKQIKKTYKKYAQICHPDKLISEKLPKAYLDYASQNFVTIKAAFDLLMRDIKLK
mgnify:CR=1 FL=1